MRRTYSLSASLGAARINQFAMLILIGVLSLILGLWIPRDRVALGVTLAAVTISIALWSAAGQWRPRRGMTGLSHVVQPVKSRAYLVPRALPPGPADFVGRTDELRRLDKAIRRVRDADPFMAVIYGAPGIGKSALAVTFAHNVARLFPDGQLFVQMRGAARGSAIAEDLIEYFVTALRGPDDPMLVDARRLREEYLELTRGRSVLFLLDDIPADFDVTALRPASSTCAFIITCRDKPEWPAADCEWVALGELEESDALSMLRTAIGGDRVDKEVTPSRELASLCGRQPQALRAAGTAVANRPDWDIRLILQQTESALLRAARQRSGGGTFDAAYALLTTDEQQALQALGVLKRSEVRPWMLAAALRTSEVRGRRLTSRLADAGLLERYNPGSGAPSYHAEEPVLKYASHQVTDQNFADTVHDLVSAAERDRGDESLAPLDELLNVEDDDSYTSAIDKVRSVMSSAQERRSRAGEAEACAALAELYADLGDMVAAEELARRAMEMSVGVDGSDHSRARASRCLVRIERRRHRLDSAVEHADRALAWAEITSDQPERIRILQEKAVVLAMKGMSAEAEVMTTDALSACQALGPDGDLLRPSVRWCHGHVLLRARRYQEAAAVLADGKRAAAQLRIPRMGAWIDLVSTQVAFETYDYDAAEHYATAAMDAFTGLRHRYGTAHCKYWLGRISLSRGHLEEAGRSLREGLETFHNCADNWIECEVSLVLAEVYRRRGQVTDAVRLQRAARRAYQRMNGHAQARQATRELLHTLLTGPPARLRLLWSAGSRPDDV